MKTFLFSWSSWSRVSVLFFVVSLLGMFPAFSQAIPAESTVPMIRSVRLEGTNVVVTARVPSGAVRVTLECRDRLGLGSWEPRAVTRLDGTGGEVTIRLPRSAPAELMRVRADDSERLPATFYTGPSTFYELGSGGFGRGMFLE